MGFRIERRAGTNGEYFLIDAVAPNTTSFSDFNLLLGTEYYYRVRSYSNSGNSEAAETSVVTSVEDTGTINVNTNLAVATFTLSGPASYSGGGTSWSQPNAPVGEYTITYGDAEGYIKPSSENKPLSSGDSITFIGTYSVPSPITSQLAAGLNLWALAGEPVASDNASSLADLINSPGATATKIFRWNAGGWEGHRVGIPLNDFPIEQGQGYFILCTAPGAFDIDAVEFAEQATGEFFAGLNLWALSAKLEQGYTASTLAAAINEQGGTVTKIFRWNSGGWEAYRVGIPLNDFIVEPGYGYFIQCTSPVSWMLPGSQ